MAVIGFVICFLVLGYLTLAVGGLLLVGSAFLGQTSDQIALLIVGAGVSCGWYYLFKFAPFTLTLVGG